MDWYSRYIVSWALSQTLALDFVLAAVDHALLQATPQIWNSDQGSHFTSPQYIQRLQTAGVQISMDGRARASDNIFMGANYLGGLGALWSLLTNRWSVARVQMPGIFVFAITQLLATLLHIPIFNWKHPVAWAWLFVYITSPVATLLVYLSMEKGYMPAPSSGPLYPGSYSAILRVFAGLSALFGLGLFLWPFIYTAPAQTSAVPWWAWKLTPLTAHVAGGWYLAAATLQYSLSRERAVDTTGPSLLGLMLVTGTQLLGAVIWRDSFDGPGLFVALYLLNASAVFTFSLLTFLRNRSAFKAVPSHSA